MAHYKNKGIICPFYKYEEGVNVRCEGFCKTCSLVISFSNKETLHMHEEMHCKSYSGWERCPLFPIINRQYEGGSKHK